MTDKTMAKRTNKQTLTDKYQNRKLTIKQHQCQKRIGGVLMYIGTISSSYVHCSVKRKNCLAKCRKFPFAQIVIHKAHIYFSFPGRVDHLGRQTHNRRMLLSVQVYPAAQKTVRFVSFAGVTREMKLSEKFEHPKRVIRKRKSKRDRPYNVHKVIIRQDNQWATKHHTHKLKIEQHE